MEQTETLKNGFYAMELNKTVWIVPNYYQNLTPVGTGAYGTVWLVCLFISNTVIFSDSLDSFLDGFICVEQIYIEDSCNTQYEV